MIETLILAEILAIIFYLSTQQEYMEYTIIRRHKFNGLEDNLSIQKTAKTLEEAITYTSALKTLETNKEVEFNIVINIEDAFTYVNTPLILDKEVA